MRALRGRLDLLSINTATLGHRQPLAEVMRACADRGLGGVAPWRRDFATISPAAAGALARELGLTVTGLCRSGMFPATTATERQERIDDNRRAIAEAAAIGARCLVLVVGGLPEGSRDLAGARQMVADGIAAIRAEAAAAGVALAIEPLHPMYAGERACVNTLAQALDLCDALGPGIGIAADAYHIWWDPRLAEQLARAGDRILAFHICDWLVPTRDLLLDRGMMGDGVIDLRGLRGLVEDAGFRGLCEVEIFSAADWWTRPPEEILAVCVQRFQSVC